MIIYDHCVAPKYFQKITSFGFHKKTITVQRKKKGLLYKYLPTFYKIAAPYGCVLKSQDLFLFVLSVLPMTGCEVYL